MIPGIKFLLTRLLPVCGSLAAVLLVFFLFVLLCSVIYRNVAEHAGWVLRDHVKWMFTPKNFITLLPVGVGLFGCAALLYTAQWW